MAGPLNHNHVDRGSANRSTCHVLYRFSAIYGLGNTSIKHSVIYEQFVSKHRGYRQNDPSSPCLAYPAVAASRAEGTAVLCEDLCEDLCECLAAGDLT